MPTTIIGDQILQRLLERCPASPSIINLELADANTEYSVSLPENTTGFLVQCRSSYDIKMSFTPGESGSKFLTIKAGQTYWKERLNGSLILYFQSATASVVVEILFWVS